MANKPASQVATKQSSAVAEAAPEWLKEGGMRGQENVTTADIIVPRLEIVQSLSPARKKGDPQYIEGAEEGMLYNNITRELYGESVTVVPVFFRKNFLVWKDRKKGGGFRGAYQTMAEADKVIMSQENPDDWAAADTAEQFCMLLKPDGKSEDVVISMSRSKLKVSRRWNSLIRLGGHDSFAKKYVISTITEKNANNQDYYNLDVKVAGFVSKEVYTAAEGLYDRVKAGMVEADRSDPGEDTTASAPTEY